MRIVQVTHERQVRLCDQARHFNGSVIHKKGAFARRARSRNPVSGVCRQTAIASSGRGGTQAYRDARIAHLFCINLTRGKGELQQYLLGVPGEFAASLRFAAHNVGRRRQKGLLALSTRRLTIRCQAIKAAASSCVASVGQRHTAPSSGAAARCLLSWSKARFHMLPLPPCRSARAWPSAAATRSRPS